MFELFEAGLAKLASHAGVRLAGRRARLRGPLGLHAEDRRQVACFRRTARRLATASATPPNRAVIARTPVELSSEPVPRQGRLRAFSREVSPVAGTDDRDGPAGARTGRAFCMARCENDGDCRDGYVCAKPTEAPWNGQIMDNDQNQLTCLVPADVPAVTAAWTVVTPTRSRPSADGERPDGRFDRRLGALHRSRSRARSRRSSPTPAPTEVSAVRGGAVMRRRRGSPWARVFGVMLGKALDAAIVVFALASAVFLALRILPGDPSALILGDQATSLERAGAACKAPPRRADVAAVCTFPEGLVTLDLGESIRRPGASAVGRVLDAARPTAELAGARGFDRARRSVSAPPCLGQGPWLGRGRAWVDRLGDGARRRPRSSRSRRSSRLRLPRGFGWCPLPGRSGGRRSRVFSSRAACSPFLSLRTSLASRAPRSTTSRARSFSVSLVRKAGATRACSGFMRCRRAIGPIVTVIGAPARRSSRRRGRARATLREARARHADPRGLCLARLFRCSRRL